MFFRMIYSYCYRRADLPWPKATQRNGVHMGRLEGRVAFVTGAGRGIGAATAIRFAEEGARVALADIDVEGCQQVQAEIEKLGSEALAISCNVADSTMVQDAVEKTVARFGRLD